jgi:hypothetical protein
MIMRARWHGLGWRIRHGARFPALIGACVVLALPLAACSSAIPGGPFPGITGYDWQVLTISHDATAASIPARLQVVVQFSADGQFAASDGVNFRSGSYRTIRDGFTVSGMRATLIGYAGHDPTVLLAVGAIGSFSDGIHATAGVTGDRLVIRVGSYTLTCRRGGRRPHLVAPKV